MGRPLFSQSPSVAVRVEPIVVTPAEQPVCERWTYWNPFDPDSEEFFSNEVYEAFVDPISNTIADRGPSPIVEDSSSTSSSDDESMDESAPRIDLIPSHAADEGVGIRIRDDAIEAVVVRRVNEESQERLRRDLNQPTTGPRTIVPIPITTAQGSPSAPPVVSGSFASPAAVDVTPRLYPRRARDMPSSPVRMTRRFHVAV